MLFQTLVSRQILPSLFAILVFVTYFYALATVLSLYFTWLVAVCHLPSTQCWSINWRLLIHLDLSLDLSQFACTITLADTSSPRWLPICNFSRVVLHHHLDFCTSSVNVSFQDLLYLLGFLFPFSVIHISREVQMSVFHTFCRSCHVFTKLIFPSNSAALLNSWYQTAMGSRVVWDWCSRSLLVGDARCSHSYLAGDHT